MTNLSLLPTPIVIIDSAKLDNITGNSKKTGNPFSINKQTGYLMTQDGQRFPEKISFLVDDARAYPPGDYHINFAESLSTDSFDGLVFKSLKLVEIEAPTTRATTPPANRTSSRNQQ